MTFEEARIKKLKTGVTYTDKETGIVFELIIVPAKQLDRDKYWEFITKNMNEFEDDDAKAYSSNDDFTIWSIGTDEHTRNHPINYTLLGRSSVIRLIG